MEMKPTYVESVPEESLECGICLEPVDGRERRFGLMQNCDHVFCISCVMEWRRSKANEIRHADDQEDVVRKCPTCRAHSDFAIPSSRYVKGDDRVALIEAYKASKAKIPCHNFGRDGKCPYSYYCFYAHTNPDGTDAKPEQERRYRMNQERRARRQEFDRYLDMADGLYEDDFSTYVVRMQTALEELTGEVDRVSSVEGIAMLMRRLHMVTSLAEDYEDDPYERGFEYDEDWV